MIITGLSGSGKSLAANCLEDLGFFCVDNLPVGLILPFCELIQRSEEPISRAALVIDARERGFLESFPEILGRLKERAVPVQLLFFDCADDVLKRRFSETRRPHPMSGSAQHSLEQAIASERRALAPLRELADRILDTTQLSAHELRAFLKSAYAERPGLEQPNVNVVSFGFKYGVPAQSDLVFDVRFLPNPYFVDALRPHDGRSAEVQAFLDRAPQTAQFLERLQALLDFLLPQYAAEGKSYLTISLGCTGGKHRSVMLAERLGGYLQGRGAPCTVIHRDLGKE